MWPVDLDAEGPLPFTYVRCEMNQVHDGYAYGSTSIEHNLAPSTNVRAPGILDMKKVVTYR